MAGLAEKRMVIVESEQNERSARRDGRRVRRRRRSSARRSCACSRPCCSPPPSRSTRRRWPARLPENVDVRATLRQLQAEYAPRGVNLVHIGKKWTFRTANDLAWLLTHEAVEPKRLSRAAIETLAIIAYHQPVTRAEIEDIRGISAAKGTIDVLLETGWIRPRGRRKAPGPSADLRHHRGVPVAFRARGAVRPAGTRRAQGLGPARRAAAGRLRGAGAVRRSGAARRRGSARAGRPRSRPRAAAGTEPARNKARSSRGPECAFDRTTCDQRAIRSRLCRRDAIAVVYRSRQTARSGARPIGRSPCFCRARSLISGENRGRVARRAARPCGG